MPTLIVFLGVIGAALNLAAVTADNWWLHAPLGGVCAWAALSYVRPGRRAR